METKELIPALREDAEWAHANEWETPITLSDHLDAAADALEALLAEVKRLNAENEAMQSIVRHAEELDEQLAAVTAERDAAVADIRQACTTCMHSGKPSCPWEGTYHHRGEHGEKIGVCNAWQWCGAGKEQNNG